MLSRDHQGPRAVLNALERLANGYDSDIVRVRQDLAIAESQLRDYRERLGKPFAHEKYLSELADLRDQLKAGLSASAHDAIEGKGPSVSEMAEGIKELKAANTIEVAPQRAHAKHAAAEEPITTRIRRRQQANSEVREASVPEAANDNLHSANDNQPPHPPAKPQTFQQRIALERQQKDQEPSLG
jgi:hypothetical protein